MKCERRYALRPEIGCLHLVQARKSERGKGEREKGERGEKEKLKWKAERATGERWKVKGAGWIGKDEYRPETRCSHRAQAA